MKYLAILIIFALVLMISAFMKLLKRIHELEGKWKKQRIQHGRDIEKNSVFSSIENRIQELKELKSCAEKEGVPELYCDCVAGIEELEYFLSQKYHKNVTTD